MAVTTSSVGNYADRILTEMINERLAPASRAPIVALKHCTTDSLAGVPSFSKAYPKALDDGAASAASEGTDITTTTTMDLGTELVITVSEGAAVRSDVTNPAIERRMPGLNGNALISAINSKSPQVLEIFAEEFARHTAMLLEKAETDVCALLDDFTTSVGSTGVDFSLSDAESAVYQLTNKEFGFEDRWVFLLAPVQVSDLRKEIAITSGGATGSVWSNDIQSIIKMNPNLSATGLVGQLFGIPVYQTATSVNPSPNSGDDEAGALLISGMGTTAMDSQGALLFLEGNRPKYVWEHDASKRLTELVSVYEYGADSHLDMGISIVTDA